MLGLLVSVERNGQQTQRGLASELGVALGLVNAYLHRCVSKGLLKVSAAPAKRYAYYLTPQGFAEKSRLTAEYLSYSFTFLRRARSAYAEIFQIAAKRGFKRIVLVGVSELAEIAMLCSIDSDIEIVAIIDSSYQGDRYLGRDVATSFEAVSNRFDCAVLTDMKSADEAYQQAGLHLGSDHVFRPSLFGSPAKQASKEKSDA